MIYIILYIDKNFVKYKINLISKNILEINKYKLLQNLNYLN